MTLSAFTIQTESLLRERRHIKCPAQDSKETHTVQQHAPHNFTRAAICLLQMRPGFTCQLPGHQHTWLQWELMFSMVPSPEATRGFCKEVLPSGPTFFSCHLSQEHCPPHPGPGPDSSNAALLNTPPACTSSGPTHRWAAGAWHQRNTEFTPVPQFASVSGFS